MTMRMRPLSAAEAGIWVNERVSDVRAVYNMPFALSLDGDLDVAALSAAVDAVVARHPVLAAAVVERDGEPWLVPAATRPALRVRVDPGEEAAELARPFDLAHGPLSRFLLYRTGSHRHRLLVVGHHLVFDGTSTDVLLHDLAGYYRGERPADLPAPAPPAEPDVAAARAYWAGRWRKPAVPVLPGLTGQLSTVDDGGTVEFTVDLPLDLAAEDLGVSRFELILASLHALLYRYGTAEPVVAVDLGTRSAADRDRIGLYVNELPVASRPDPGAPFADLARRLRTDLRELYRFRDVPLARAVPGIRPAVALSPVTLTYRRRAPAPEFPGLAVDVDWVLFPGTARGALRVHLVDGPDRLGAVFQYPSGIVGAAAAQRMSGHWVALLRAAVDRPWTPLAELPVMPDDEAAVLTATAVDHPGDPLPVLITGNTDATAVIAEDAELTYEELDAAATRVAYRLRAAGAGPGTVVGVCADRGAGLVTGLLGVLKAGAAYLPLDPTHPADRLAHLLDDAGAALLLTQKRLADTLAAYGGTRILLDGLDTAEPVPLPPPGPDDRAYVIYTSGSTGRPKGVAIGHRALTNLLLSMRDLLGAGPDTTWLALTSPSFDIAALELFLPLVVGGRVVVAGGRDGAALCRLARTHGVTHIQATPSGWRMLLDSGFDRPDVDALCGGEALPLPLARELRGRVRRLWNVYGPTETTIWSTAWEVPADPQEVSIGRPVPNTQVYVLDPRRRPVPAGIPGELYLGGAGLADGYPADPGLTAERFVTLPSGGRAYRTGDLVRYADDGRLTYLGRLDDQVKLRGYRIEPAEVEARLLEHHDVTGAAVALRGETLVAYVTGTASAEGLRAHVSATLPEYMVPARYVKLDALPLTANGKLDRRALPEPPSMPAPPAAPAGDGIAAQVAEICREVLRRDAIGTGDSLFDLGAHSLTMTAIAARIRRRMGADLPLYVFYDDPTVATIADAVAGSRAGR
jgi:amino acid adenylation domain-containing protein